MRTIIEVPDDLIARLDQMGERGKASRAALIREAIVDYLARHSLPDAEAAFGLWSDRSIDARDYEDSLRADWEGR